jgi:hypothetical protein
MYACLEVDVVVGGFEKAHFDFVPGVARTSTIGLRLSMSAGDLSAPARVSCDSSSRNCASDFVSQYGLLAHECGHIVLHSTREAWTKPDHVKS